MIEELREQRESAHEAMVEVRDKLAQQRGKVYELEQEVLAEREAIRQPVQSVTDLKKREANLTKQKARFDLEKRFVNELATVHQDASQLFQGYDKQLKKAVERHLKQEALAVDEEEEALFDVALLRQMTHKMLLGYATRAIEPMVLARIRGGGVRQKAMQQAAEIAAEAMGINTAETHIFAEREARAANMGRL